MMSSIFSRMLSIRYDSRNLSVSEAREMLRNTLRWRELFDLNAAMKEEFPEEIFGGLGGIHGHDKEGRPIVYVSSRNILRRLT